MVGGPDSFQFHGSLALGNGIAARARPSRRPLRTYALLELAVGVCGCTIVFALPSLGDWLRPVFQTLWSTPALIGGLCRLLLSFLILLVPTTAMGMTFPVLLSDEALRRHDFGRVVGLPYGANTLGAVAGV